MGACSSKPRVRGDDDPPSPEQDPTSPAPRNPFRSRSNRSSNKNLPSPSTVATRNSSGKRVKENVAISKDSSENGNTQPEQTKQEHAPSNSQPGLEFESVKHEPSKTQEQSTKPEPTETQAESTKPEPSNTQAESTKPEPSKTQAISTEPEPTKPDSPEMPSKEAEMKIIDSEIKLLESATRTLSKKPGQGGISIVPNHTPNESETKLLASLATPKSETSHDEPETKLQVSETHKTPELMKEELPPDKDTEPPKPENEVRGTEAVSESETRKDRDPETMTEMSNVSSRQPSLDFLDASDKMVVDKGVLESMPDTMKAKLEKAVLQPIVSSKTVSDWNAEVEKAMEEPVGDAKTETDVSHENVDNEEDTRVPTTVGTKGLDPVRVS